MRFNFICVLILATGHSATAQFYPSANACWTGRDDDGAPPGYDVRYQMGATPDTLINQVVYKKIEEYRDYEFARAYYVRSDPSGKGYAYLPDSATEYLTGDISAQAGDTVYDVLWSFTHQSGVEYFFADMVVHSVVTLTNANVTVHRHYVNFVISDLPSSFLFWQEGMGVSYGPMLELTGNPGVCTVGDTVMVGDDWLPGPIGVEVCPYIIDDIMSHGPSSNGAIKLTPNPSNGLFTLSNGLKQHFTVFNAQGQFISNGNGPVIDLSAQPTGLYTAVIGTASGQQVVRLVVQRE
ncbi:MAG: T9SS type A sorting domain-containing protein [Flavobacteriales bacterium]|nr:T9SS type A sorting domain-containing protein [Flavobacteriales bacterium]